MPNFRMRGFTLLATFLLAVIFYFSPAQFPVVLHKLSLVCVAGVLGYWLDRHLFPYARPHEALEDADTAPDRITLAAVAQLRRALIVVGAMVALGLAL